MKSIVTTDKAIKTSQFSQKTIKSELKIYYDERHLNVTGNLEGKSELIDLKNYRYENKLKRGTSMLEFYSGKKNEWVSLKKENSEFCKRHELKKNLGDEDTMKIALNLDETPPTIKKS